MNGLNLLSNIEFVRTHSGASSAQTATGAVIDAANCEGVLFVASFGTVATTTGTNMYVNAGDTTSSTGHSKLADTTVEDASTGSNRLLAVDLYRPTEGQYVSNSIVLKTGDVLDGAIAIKYGVRKAPVSQSTSYFSSTAAFTTAVSPSTA